MKHKKIIILFFGIILIGITSYIIIKKLPKQVEYKETKINIITSLEDTLENNTIWCGTFNLIWNDLKNDLVKQDIKFSNQTSVVDNLNLGTFTEDNLSEESYYKVVKPTSPELKKEIEDAIKTKFNEKSDILDSMNWEKTNGKDYTLYAMLKKEFEFPYQFDEISTGTFKKTENVKYFGITSASEEKLYNQVNVLYYENENNFAIKLLTKTIDEIILIKGAGENTLKETYDKLLIKSNEYKGEKNFTNKDELKVPNLNFKIKKEFKDLENNLFYFSNGDEYEITKALQTISFELDSKGGKIKSEASMEAKNTSALINKIERQFILDNTFIIFLKEQNKELPYFGAKIDDITEFINIQNN